MQKKNRILIEIPSGKIPKEIRNADFRLKLFKRKNRAHNFFSDRLRIRLPGNGFFPPSRNTVKCLIRTHYCCESQFVTSFKSKNCASVDWFALIKICTMLKQKHRFSCWLRFPVYVCWTMSNGHSNTVGFSSFQMNSTRKQSELKKSPNR